MHGEDLHLGTRGQDLGSLVHLAGAQGEAGSHLDVTHNHHDRDPPQGHLGTTGLLPGKMVPAHQGRRETVRQGMRAHFLGTKEAGRNRRGRMMENILHGRVLPGRAMGPNLGTTEPIPGTMGKGRKAAHKWVRMTTSEPQTNATMLRASLPRCSTMQLVRSLVAGRILALLQDNHQERRRNNHQVQVHPFAGLLLNQISAGLGRHQGSG